MAAELGEVKVAAVSAVNHFNCKQLPVSVMCTYISRMAEVEGVCV